MSSFELVLLNTYVFISSFRKSQTQYHCDLKLLSTKLLTRLKAMNLVYE
jgi:hypothetical protein